MKKAKTLIERAKEGRLPAYALKLARREGLDFSRLARLIATGKAVIPYNRQVKLKMPCIIGKGASVKINANIGTSLNFPYLKEELKKMRAACQAGADTIMDLSTGGNIAKIRKSIRSKCPLPLGTVPVYELAESLRRQGKGIIRAKPDDFFNIVEKHARDGVDFMTIHCGLTLAGLEA